MSETWLLSDLHLGHANIIRYCDRPFADAEEMDRVIIENWTKTIAARDTVYVIGDVCFHNSERTVEIIQALPGYKVLLKGNHDLRRTDTLWTRAGFGVVTDSTVIHDRTYRAVELSHYPFWGGHAPKTPILFHGHSHNQFKAKIHTTNGRVLLNFSVECWEYKPVHIEQAFDTVDRIEAKFKEDGQTVFGIGEV